METIKTAKELGKTGANKYLEHACIECGKKRWVMLRKGKPKNLHCKSCSNKGQENPNWQGKENRDGRGYVRIFLRPDDFFYPMATKQGYVTGHRLVMAKYLRRCLHPWEIVHHKGTKYPKGSLKNKGDNRIENLELTSYEFHHAITELEKKIKKLEEENRCLKKQIVCVIE